jgi:putative flippase GtrA
MGKIKELFIKNKTTIIQFGKFMLVGCLNFAVDYSIFLLLNQVFGVYSVIANIISYSCGVINSYFFNRMWTFKKKLKYLSTDFLKFIFVNLVSMGVSTLAVYIFVERFLIPAWIGKALSTFFSFTVNFAGNKLLVFRDKKEKEKET